MENSEYLVILTTPSRNDGVRLQIERTVGTHGKHRDLRLKQLPTWKQPSKRFGVEQVTSSP